MYYDDFEEDNRTIEELYSELVPSFVKVDSLEDFITLAKERSLFVSTSKWLYSQYYNAGLLEMELNYRTSKERGSIPSNLTLEEYEENYEDFEHEYDIVSIKEHEYGKKAFLEVYLSSPNIEDSIDENTANLAALLTAFEERLDEWKEQGRVEEEAKRREKSRAEKEKRENTPIENIIDCPESLFKDILTASISDLPNTKSVRLNVGKLQVILQDGSPEALIGRATKANRLIGKVVCPLSVEDILANIEEIKQGKTF